MHCDIFFLLKKKKLHQNDNRALFQRIKRPPQSQSLMTLMPAGVKDGLTKSEACSENRQSVASLPGETLKILQLHYTRIALCPRRAYIIV